MIKTSGGQTAAYWLGNYLYDFLVFTALNVFYFCLGKVGDLQAFKQASYGSFILLSVLWGHSLVGFCKSLLLSHYYFTLK